jgi:hypothetical protein
LLIVPLPVAVAVRVKVALPPTARSTDALRFPLPLAGQLDPELAVHVHVAPVSAVGNVSVTVAPVTAARPAFDATIV